MAPKGKAVKMSLHELIQGTGGSKDMLEPTYSSGVSRDRDADRSEGDWGRGPPKDRMGFGGGLGGERRGLNTTGGFGSNSADADEDSSWRKPDSRPKEQPSFGRGGGGGGGGGGDEVFSRETLLSRKELVAAEGQRAPARHTDFAGRSTNEDVDFSNVRGAPRPTTSGLGLGRPTTARPSERNFGLSNSSISYLSAASSRGDENQGLWRTNQPLMPRVDTRPEEMRNRFKGRGKLKAEETTVADSTLKATETSDNTGTTAASISNNEPNATIVTSAAAETSDTVTFSKPHETDLGDITREEPSDIGVAGEMSVLSQETTKPKAEEEPKEPKEPSSVSAINVSTSPVGTTNISKLAGEATSLETPPPKIGFQANSQPVRLWKPRILQQGGSSRSTDQGTTLEELVKQKQSEAAAASAVNTVSAGEEDTAKARYRRTLQEREQKKREEEERKRSEKEERERLERIALEKLMTGDVEKTRTMEDVITSSLHNKIDPEHVLERFRKGLAQGELETLVPSIVIAKCLAIKSFEILSKTIGSSTTDIQRLSLVEEVVKALKPTLLFVFNSSKVRRHKLQFLNETQRFIHAMKFPRISEGLALIEAVWDALYMTDTIEEQYFNLWYESTDDDTLGRSNVMFQMLAWFDWLKSATVEGEEALDESGGEEEEQEDDD